MLFDEPTSALDPRMTAEVLAVMTDLAGDGLTMIVVTHAMQFARRVAHTVHVFGDGRVIESGPPARSSRTRAKRRRGCCFPTSRRRERGAGVEPGRCGAPSSKIRRPSSAQVLPSQPAAVRWPRGPGRSRLLAILEGREQGIPPLRSRLDLTQPRAEPLGLFFQFLQLLLGLPPVPLDEGPGVLLGVIVARAGGARGDCGRLAGSAYCGSPGAVLRGLAGGFGEFQRAPGFGAGGRVSEGNPGALSSDRLEPG